MNTQEIANILKQGPEGKRLLDYLLPRIERLEVKMQDFEQFLAKED